MQRGNFCSRRLLAAVPLLLGALSSTGCVPGVAWLPDSSGFIYTGGEHFTRLVHYDLATGQKHILVEDTGAATLWPALSPDGQRIAVARLILTRGQKQAKLQLIFYSRAGKEQNRSRVLDWMELKGPATSEAIPDNSVLPQLFWAPQGDRILVHCSGEYTAVYDVKADRLIHAGRSQLLTFGGTPVRPDGSGFLVMKNLKWAQWWKEKPGTVDPDPGFAFVDWDGKENPLKAPAYFRDADALKKEEDGNKLGALLWPAYYESGWHGAVAQVSWNVDRLRFLTNKGEAVLDQIKPEQTPDGLLIMRQYAFPGGQARLRVVVARKDNPKAEGTGSTRIEVLKAGGRQPQVILENTMPAVFIPSPNGKRVAVWTMKKGGKGKDEALLLVVNDQGEVMARIPVER